MPRKLQPPGPRDNNTLRPIAAQAVTLVRNAGWAA